jgi:hypothetical protein
MKPQPIILLACLLTAYPSLAETCDQIGHAPGKEGRVQSDFCREWLELHPCQQQISKPCSSFTGGHLVDIGQTLILGQPIHIALGSLAPQNGFGTGLAFVEHKDFESERRLTFDVDAVATNNLSWRAGSYLTTYKLPKSAEPIGVVMGTPTSQMKTPSFEIAPIFTLYAQATSLNRLYYYGLGPNTVPADKAAFGLTETIAGAGAIFPLNRGGISFTAEFNGRVPQLRSDTSDSVPTVAALYTEATAPGLTHSAAFLQPGIGIQIRPSLFSDHLRLHYLVNFQDFTAVGGHYSFRRWSTDIGHEFPLARKVHLTAADPQNGPDSCASVGSACPHISTTINNEGSVSLRLLMIGAASGAGSDVPFYFDPTSGGSNLDGNPILASYPDYRFRSPNLILLRGAIEHALPKLPLGVYFSADAAKSPLTRSDIDFNNLRTSYSLGLNVRAGGLPVVYLLFAWGGNEGTHTTFSISNTLLGASPRPSLF